MNRFLDKLEKKISILDDKTRGKIINRYENDIKENIKKGMSEEAAISSLGDLDSIVDDIYDQHNLNKNMKPKSKSLHNILDSASETISDFCHELAERTRTFTAGRSLEFCFEVALKIIIFIMAIFVLQLPFMLLNALTSQLTGLLFYPFSTAFSWIFTFIFGVVYVGICIVILIAMFKGYWTKPEVKNKETKEIEEEKPKKRTGDYLSTIIKIIIFVILVVPSIILNIALLILTVIALFLVFNGVSIIGLAILIFGLFLISTVLTSFITDAVDNKNKNYKLRTVSSVLFIIVGAVLFVDNVFRFNYHDDIFESNFEYVTISETIKIDAAWAILTDGNAEAIIDNEILDNVLLIEIIYFDRFVDINIEIEEINGRNLLMIYSSERAMNMDKLMYIYNNALVDLQNNNIFNYRDLRDFNVKIYLNENTRELLR